MSDDLFLMPEDARGGDLVSIDVFEGRLVVMEATGEETETETSFGPSTYLPSRVLDVEGKGEWEEMWVWSAGVRSQLKAAKRAGKPIVGVVGKGEAKPGRSAPWLIKDADAKQIAKARDAYTAASTPF
jgi:hypothetical protein